MSGGKRASVREHRGWLFESGREGDITHSRHCGKTPFPPFHPSEKGEARKRKNELCFLDYCAPAPDGQRHPPHSYTAVCRN